MEDIPELSPHLAGVWDSFRILSHCRTYYGENIGAISPTDIKSHFEILGLSGTVAIDYYELLITLDASYIAYFVEERENARKKAESKNANTRTNHGR